MKGEVLPLFAVAPVMAFTYEGAIDPIFEYIKTLEYDQESEGNAKSSDRYILKQEIFQDLNNFFLESIQTYAKKICDTDHTATIQQSWVNVNQPGKQHPSHWHSNSWLSGVFYIASDGDKGSPITFHSGLKNFAYNFDDPNEDAEFNPYTCSSCDIASIPGNLLIFSSLQPHSVPVNKSETNRVSISFNTFPTVPFGGRDRLNLIDF
tara:strand:+ start:623 stop:1243 length:621 start_codon:yes stop_codon:yes gene_type:complete